jgi:hypothetical protein
VLDDSELDNTQGAGINAAADGWLSGNLLIEVYDNECLRMIMCNRDVN